MLVPMARNPCPACGTRRARRACPALGRQICAVCCGTKRRVEIACPSDCPYLRSSQAHPPAVVQRRQERDLGFLFPLLGPLTERQQEMVLLLQTSLRLGPRESPGLSDADVEQGARAAAETFETASRGIVYEHRPASLNAQRVANDLQKVVDAHRKQGVRLPDGDIAAALRCIETAAREATRALGGGDAEYLALIDRMIRSAQKDDAPAGPRIVTP